MDQSAFSKAAGAASVQRARDTLPPAPLAALPGQSSALTDPADLVARALAILAEHKIRLDDARPLSGEAARAPPAA